MTAATLSPAADETAPNETALRAAGRRESLALGALAAPGLALIGIVALAPLAWLFGL
jgi:hypothetical protein